MITFIISLAASFTALVMVGYRLKVALVLSVAAVILWAAICLAIAGAAA
jgi:uncharacterized membrane protein YwaF